MDSFSYEVSDGNGGSDQATLEITINNTNDAPSFSSDPVVETTANEESRLVHRYVDLRRPVMQRILRLRHRLANAARGVLDDRGFVDRPGGYD